MKKIAHALVRINQTPDGKLIMDYLHQKVCGRIIGPNAPTSELWYLEGQRAMIATLDHLLEIGKTE